MTLCIYENCKNEKYCKNLCPKHYRLVNRARIRENNKRYEKSHPWIRQKADRLYRQRHPEKRRQMLRDWYKRNPLKKGEYDQKHYIKNRETILLKNRLAGRHTPNLPPLVRQAMARVRKKQNGTCQWYGCGLTMKETIINVHHIFPRSEYPELETVEQYMICYCEDHHRLWHRRRWESNRTPRTMTL